MKPTFRDVRVTSAKFEEELKTKFPVLRTRKVWCHWILIRAFSTKAFLWSLSDDKQKFIYLGISYDVVYADGYTFETIQNEKSIGISARVFTNVNGETFYIAVVTKWQGEKFA